MRRKIVYAVLCLAGLILAVVVSDWYFSRPSGIYLAEGGLGYMVFNNSGTRIIEPRWMPDAEDRPDMYDARPRWTRGGFILEYTLTKKTLQELGAASSEAGFLKLSRSKMIRGDFDLIEFLPDSSYYVNPDDARSHRTVLEVSRPSFLQRMDDERVPAYFKAQRESRDSARALEIAEALLNSHPDDLYVRALYLEAALKKPDFASFENRLKEWSAGFAASADPYQKRIPKIGALMLRSKALTDAGRNAWPVIEHAMVKKRSDDRNTQPVLNDLETWLRELPQVLECEDYLYPPTELNPSRMSDNNYLNPQILAKVTDTWALILMIQGKREEALRLLLAGLYHSKWRSENGVLIDRLIGIALKAVHVNRLSIYAFNACETEAELKAVAEGIERMSSGPRSMPRESFAEFMNLGESLLTHSEADIQFKVALTKYENLRGAIAARRQLLSNGAFPSNDSQLLTWLPQGLPRDPFTSGTLKYKTDENAFTIYSVGPETADNGAEVTYDPTNGSVSVGDIFSRVPKEREFPVPREGTRARTPEDVHRQYPNGLPFDYFGKTRGRPLGISAGPPVTIYSLGPDNDGNEMPEGIGENYQVEMIYDPSNGITSNGDLFIHLPAE